MTAASGCSCSNLWLFNSAGPIGLLCDYLRIARLLHWLSTLSPPLASFTLSTLSHAVAPGRENRRAPPINIQGYRTSAVLHEFFNSYRWLLTIRLKIFRIFARTLNLIVGRIFRGSTTEGMCMNILQLFFRIFFKNLFILNWKPHFNNSATHYFSPGIQSIKIYEEIM